MMQRRTFNYVMLSGSPAYRSPWMEIYNVDEESVLASSATATEGLSYDEDVIDGSEGNETFTSGGSQLEW